MTTEQKNKNIDALTRLQQLVSDLRGDHGCPWDRQQTPISLKKYLLEECRELAEAIDIGHPEHIREEIGDVFFILIMLAACFEEQHLFSADDALDEVIAKMIRRHPHVFADATVTDEKTLRSQWEKIKAQEKKPYTRAPLK
ncbi:MazG nucleotide pyrophosphohydrolase domain-containing protein [Desulfobulbus alkaliphilus]|uniref:MazG nucleotide pyrophosphohydrolase domain-containing protein n=1 Tax=Desulfobulbus alkaliphilus TaxID=869814 RepID=UPI001964CD62|nr:MazG nucleotide pyrophosphohydrolase domain-containing protein [Desulfobulbus alkaliphilus]MBM9537168.1 nucleotide pyrophosphohydrolase [Desulfobulbus alkaliphilus]